jgi:hypothetical protein
MKEKVFLYFAEFEFFCNNAENSIGEEAVAELIEHLILGITCSLYFKHITTREL